MSQGSSSNDAYRAGGESTSERPDEREELLKSVIEATFSGASESLNDQEWESLRAVARSTARDQPLDLGLVCDLVRALVGTRFSALKGDQAIFDRLCFRVAGALWSHPASLSRLRRFWELLLGQVR
jgi:hypothetical protein